MNYFDKINDWIRGVEASIVNLLSAVGPWASPIIPAYMTFEHVGDSLGFPTEIAWISALVVEILGLSTVSTSLSFWSHNKREGALKNKAPVQLVIGTFAFYLLVVLSINVFLDVGKIVSNGIQGDFYEWTKIGVRALLTLLSVPAALIMAVRAQHQDLLRHIRDDKEARRIERERRKEGNLSKVSETFEVDSDERPSSWRTFKKTMDANDIYVLLNEKDKSKISRRFNIIIRTVENWIRYCKRDYKLVQDIIIDMANNGQGIPSVTYLMDTPSSPPKSLSRYAMADFIMENSEDLIADGLIAEQDVIDASKFISDARE